MSTNLLSKIICQAIGTVYDFDIKRFPRAVRIETTNACNAQCTICPHPGMERPTTRIAEGSLKKIIDECSENNCAEVHLHNFGEPFLDKRLEQFISYAKSKGIRKVKIFSNGSIISEDRAKGVLLAGIDEIKVSFDGATKEEFEKMRAPLKFDEVVSNLLRLVELRDELKSTAKIMVACCSTTDKSKTMKLLESKADGFSFGKIHNWGGEGEQKQSGVRKPCSRLWRTFTILADGNVSLCCLDYDGQVNFGNIEDLSIAEIWSSGKYNLARRFHRSADQKKISLCGNCSKAYL